MKTFEIVWFKICWLIFEFRLNISSFVSLIPSLLKEKSHLHCSQEEVICVCRILSDCNLTLFIGAFKLRYWVFVLKILFLLFVVVIVFFVVFFLRADFVYWGMSLCNSFISLVVEGFYKTQTSILIISLSKM